MKGKAVFCFSMAALSAVSAVLWANDGLHAIRDDVWPDAMHYFNSNHKESSNVTLTDDTSAKESAD